MQKTVTETLLGIYDRVLGEKPGEGAREFIGHLSWIGVSFFAAKVVSTLVNITAGRVLGPQEYGKINVMVSAGVILSTFLSAGINLSIVKYGVRGEERDQTLSTGAAMALTVAACCITLAFLFRTQLSRLFGIDGGMLLLAFLYALSTAAFLIASGMQQSLGSFRERGISEIFFSLVLAAAFGAGLLLVGRVYLTMAYAYIAAFGVMAAFWFCRMAAHIKPSLVSRAQFRKMSEYSFYSFGASRSSCLVFNVQGLMLNAHLSARDVGVYAAYYTATVGVSGYLAYAATTVLFPKASATTNRRRLWDIAVRVLMKLSPAAFIFFLLLQTAVLALMGRDQYGMDPLLMTLFAAGGTLMLAQSLLGQIIFSESVRASRLSLLMSAGAGLVNFALCLALIPAAGVKGVPLAFCLTYVLVMLWLWKAKDSYLE